MRISTTWVVRVCGVCDRSLLQGERARKLRRAAGGEAIDVCALCEREALAHGWVREGSPLQPSVRTAEPRKQRLPSLAAIFGGVRRPAPEPVAGDPILRRLSESERAAVEAAEVFNASPFRRTAAGLMRSLGDARVSIVPLPGVHGEVVVTIAWELSWYQYRVDPDGPQAVRLEERGFELEEIDEVLCEWNARLAEDGRVIPEISPL